MNNRKFSKHWTVGHSASRVAITFSTKISFIFSLKSFFVINFYYCFCFNLFVKLATMAYAIEKMDRYKRRMHKLCELPDARRTRESVTAKSVRYVIIKYVVIGLLTLQLCISGLLKVLREIF